MNFELLKDESRLHFIWRIYTYQKDTASLTNEQCGEICRNELAEELDESAYRKVFQSFMNMWDAIKEEYTNEQLEARLVEIDKREDELYKQQVKTSDSNRMKRATLRDEARIENLISTIENCANKIEPFELNIKEIELNGDKSAILTISDFHYGMVTDNYWNKYNVDITKARVEELIHKTIKYCQIHDIGTLYIANLGDMVSGSIHVSVRIAAEENAIDQVMNVSELIAGMMKQFVDYGLKVKYVSVTDNHARLQKNLSEHVEKENFSRITDWWLKSRLDGIVEFLDSNIDESISLFTVEGKNIIAVHGHLDSPTSIVQDMALGLEITPHIVLMGHYHNRKELSIANSTVFVNGSLCSTDEYAKSKRLFGKASQNLIIFDDSDLVSIRLNLQ